MAITARTKPEAIRRILGVSEKPRVVLVWHLGLLKLLPFLRARDARVVVFLHGIEAWRVQDLFTRQLLRRVNLFLANSAHTYARFLEFAPEARTIPHQIIPLGVGAPDYETSTPQDPPSALVLSRLERAEDYKGHRELIAAWRGVRAQIPGATLWIAGDGNLRGELETLARTHDVQNVVHFWGRVSESQKKELLQACRCLAMPSRGEGFGLVYPEAMRAGRPCLVSDCDGGREAVHPPEAGLEVNPTDTPAVTEALVRLLGSGPEWAGWSERARARYEANFTAARFQQRLITALAGLW